MRRVVLLTAVLILLISPANLTGRAEDSAPVPLYLSLPDPGSLDPIVLSTEPELFDALFASLPDLAASITAEPGSSASVWAVTLRAGITWSDGTPITAADVRASILHWLESAPTPPTSLFVIEYAADYYAGLNGTTAELVGVDAVSSGGVETVYFILTGPTAHFPALLTRPEFAPLPVLPPADPLPLLTSGAYTLSAYQPGEGMILALRSQSNPAVVVTFDAGPEASLSRFLRGGVDTVEMPAGRFAGLQSDPLLSAYLGRGSLQASYAAGFNTAVQPFENLHLRRALAMSANRALLAGLAPERLLAVDALVPAGVLGYTGGTALPGDGGAARAELALSELVITDPLYITYPPGDPLAASLANELASQIHDILQLEIFAVAGTGTDSGLWLARLPAAYPDAAAWLGALGTDQLGSQWADADYTTGLTAAAATLDDGLREQYYADAESLLVTEEAVVVPLAVEVPAIITRPYLFPTAAIRTAFWEDWLLERTETAPAATTEWVLSRDSLIYNFEFLDWDTQPEGDIYTHTTLDIHPLVPPGGWQPTAHYFDIQINPPPAGGEYKLTVRFSPLELAGAQPALFWRDAPDAPWLIQPTFITPGSDPVELVAYPLATQTGEWAVFSRYPLYLPSLSR